MTLSFSGVGDIVLSRSCWRAYITSLHKVREMMGRADFRFANLEAVFLSEADQPIPSVNNGFNSSKKSG
ncbi:hypothetical protein Heshes_26580 [Alicyclobacillus hesperidum]|uniref:Capsule synthesis protein PGA_cap n=1 Tax=Alicyclobacillus hesperidum TaxID=89784 RepID=A0A1H2YK29_9BACL|nr:hypothetical protein Heshes_26580 [Alicyclobacillus hesperidum]SDX05440.1 capsule synthesis protein PGA_cap [Alicyclobacillus hesperidum]